jgi:FtsP/CotA-like multicopper oxidase with cupredoxin domain
MPPPAVAARYKAHKAYKAYKAGRVAGAPPAYNPMAGVHSYHQHVNHYQVTGFGEDVDPDYFRIGEWRDTVGQIVTGSYIRMRPTTFTGGAVFHCHVSQHEDMGMMGIYEIIKC